MPTALVTGATGFLGWHVAHALLRRGFRVKALHRPTSKLRELDAEPVIGDLRDPSSLQRAVNNCDLVFHVAADYRLWSRNPSEMYQSNVEGTRNLLDAAHAAGVERIVYTSTVGCIGVPPGDIGDETKPVTIDDMAGHYKRSKWLAEQVALEKASAGVPVVIVNPTAPMGDHDWKPTPTGKIVLDFLSGNMPGFVDTGLNVVDAADTAEGHVLAAERGKPGERYILGSENLTLEQILHKLGKIVSKPAPTFQVPFALAYGAALFYTGMAAFTGKEPRASLEAVRMARKKMWVSHAKAARELGFSPAPAEVALRKAVDWFKANGYC